MKLMDGIVIDQRCLFEGLIFLIFASINLLLIEAIILFHFQIPKSLDFAKKGLEFMMILVKTPTFIQILHPFSKFTNRLAKTPTFIPMQQPLFKYTNLYPNATTIQQTFQPFIQILQQFSKLISLYPNITYIQQIH